MTVFDVIVVGAGAAGAPLAARLSEDPERSVLVIEAGAAPSRIEDFPAELLDAGTLLGAHPDHKANWAFPAELADGHPFTIARGRMLGGSTATNGGYFVRARAQDFARWSAGGNEEWSYEKSLPFYRRLENDLQYGESEQHGGSGPMRVNRPSPQHPAQAAFEAAARELGYPQEADKNGEGAAGIGAVPLNVVDGIRWNTGIACLNPVRDRPNLTIQGDTLARRVIFEGPRAIGVEVEREGRVSIAHAREVVLAAGSVESPHLLLLSGIGRRSQLDDCGVPLLVDAPGVGRDFSDHPNLTVRWRPRQRIVDYLSRQFLTSALNFRARSAPGELEILQVVKPTTFLLGGVRPTEDELSFIVALQSGASRGRISLASADPATPPRIEYNYLSTAGDRAAMREGVRTTVALLQSPAFAPLFDHLVGLDAANLDDDARLDEWMRRHLGTAIHLCGSARFGVADDPGAVVDQYGRVHGVHGLRVADTSILPTAPSRGVAATAVLIGERIADFMRRGL